MKYFVAACFFAVGSAAAGMDVKNYRALSAAMPEGATDTTIETYLAGVADTLRAQRDETGKISFLFEGKPYELCPPKEFPMHPKLLKRMVDMQLKEPGKLEKHIGADWETVPLAVLVISSVKQTFICKT